MDRYDERVQGKLNHDLDRVCPSCFSAIGYPCTVKKLDGSDMVKWIHEERKVANEQNVVAEGNVDANAS